MTKYLPIYTVKERPPANEELILLLDIETAFDMGSVQPEWVKIEYSWAIVDKDGQDTGSQCLYEGPDDVKQFVPNEPGEQLKLVMLAEGYELLETARYALEADVYALFPDEFLPKS